MTEKDQQQDVKDAVRAAVKSGTDVHQQIKDITLKALTKRQLDITGFTGIRICRIYVCHDRRYLVTAFHLEKRAINVTSTH